MSTTKKLRTLRLELAGDRCVPKVVGLEKHPPEGTERKWAPYSKMLTTSSRRPRELASRDLSLVLVKQPIRCPEAGNWQGTAKLIALRSSSEWASISVLLHLAERPPESTEGKWALYNEMLTTSPLRGLSSEVWRQRHQDLFAEVFLELMTVLRSVLPRDDFS